MSDAIRCGQCRWWRPEDDREENGYGHCHLNPPVYIGSDPMDSANWYQPMTFFNDFCSRGEPKTEDET